MVLVRIIFFLLFYRIFCRKSSLKLVTFSFLSLCQGKVKKVTSQFSQYYWEAKTMVRFVVEIFNEFFRRFYWILKLESFFFFFFATCYFFLIFNAVVTELLIGLPIFIFRSCERNSAITIILMKYFLCVWQS